MTTVATLDPGTLTDGMTLEQWTEHGRQLFAVEKRIGWAIADWWAFGTAIDPSTGKPRYGERAKAVAEGIFGRKFQHLMNAGSVARAFPETSRQQEVPFTHHQEVASLARSDPEGAQEILTAAATAPGGMAASDVREAVREARATPEQPIVSQAVIDSMSVRRLVTYWNRATPAARTEFIELVEAADGGFIEL